MQFPIENTTVTVIIQKFDYDITIIFEKINGNTVIQNLVRPPLMRVGEIHINLSVNKVAFFELLKLCVPPRS